LHKMLLEIALRKASWIKSGVEKAGFEDVLAKARELWAPRKPAAAGPASYGAVDGSNNGVEFKGFTLYAVLGYGVGKAGGSVVECGVGDVDLLLHGDAGERVRLLREISEIKAAALLQEPELLMIDGSVTSLLIRPRPFAEPKLRFVVEKLWLETSRDIASRLWSELRKQLESGNRLLYDHFISHHIAREYGLLVSSKVELAVLLEYFEKLLSLRILLEQRVVGRRVPSAVFVSKTSRSRDYFGELEDKLNRTLPPDMLVFSYAGVGAGFSKPIEVVREEVKRAMPRYGELESLVAEFYSKLKFILFYAKLEEGGPILMIEVPVDADTVSAGDYSEVAARIFEQLSGLSYNGYPYPLIEAHKNSLITRDDVQSIAMLLGLLPRPTGREVLLEWL